MLEPELLRYWLKQADEAYQEQNWEYALRAYDDTCRLAPLEPRARLGAALSLLALNRPVEALKRLVGLQSREALYATAVSELLLGRRTALALFETALPLGGRGLSPRLPAPALTLALHRLEEGLRLHPQNAAAWTSRGVLLEWLGYSSEAFGSLAAALRVEPGYTLAARLQDAWLSQLLCLPAPGPVRPQPVEVLVPTPTREARPQWYRDHLLGGDAAALFERARSYFDQRQWEEAHEYLRRVMLVEPEHIDSCSLRFEVLLRLDRPAEARQEGYCLMDLLEKQNRLVEAIELGTRMFELWPDDERLLCKHQLLFHRAGNVELAARWTFELVRRHRFSQQFDQAAAALYWLVRRPLPGAERVRAELLLLAVLLASNKFEPALDRLEVLLAQWNLAKLAGERSYSRRAGTVKRLLESAAPGLSKTDTRLAPLQAQVERLLSD